MAYQNDVTSLIARVRLYGSFPTSNTTSSDQDICSLLNDEFQNTIIPAVLTAREENLVVTQDFQLGANSSYASGYQTSIEIPSWATASRLRGVYWLDTNGNPTQLERFSPEKISGYNSMQLTNNFIGLAGFFIQGNRIYLYPESVVAQNNVTIRLSLHRRPNDLILTSQAGQITSINGQLITVAGTPGFQLSQLVDAIRPNAPYDFVTDYSQVQPSYSTPPALTEQRVIYVSGSSFQLAGPNTVNQLRVGDWISPTGQSPFPQFLPNEAFPVLCQAVVVRIMGSIGDDDGEAMAIEKYKKLEDDFMTMITPRVEGSSKVVSANAGIARAARIGYRWAR